MKTYIVTYGEGDGNWSTGNGWSDSFECIAENEDSAIEGGWEVVFDNHINDQLPDPGDEDFEYIQEQLTSTFFVTVELKETK